MPGEIVAEKFGRKAVCPSPHCLEFRVAYLFYDHPLRDGRHRSLHPEVKLIDEEGIYAEEPETQAPQAFHQPLVHKIAEEQLYIVCAHC